MFNLLARRWVGYGSALVALVPLAGAVWTWWPGAFTKITSENYLPHGYCYLWNRQLLTLHVVSDSIIFFSYLAIASTLAVLLHRAKRQLPFSWIVVAFGIFIVSCGFTHAMDVVVLWRPLYLLAGDIKLLTAIASLTTAMALPFLVPRVQEMVIEAQASQARHAQLQRLSADWERQFADSRRAEAEARRSELRFLGAAETSLDCLYLADAVRDANGEIEDFVFTYVNGNAVRLVTVPIEQLIGGRVCDIFPLNRKIGLFDKYKLIVLTGETYVGEFAIQEENIRTSWLRIQAAKLGDGVAITASDITGRKKQEEALRTSEARFHAFMENNPSLVFIKDREGRLVYMNGSCLRMWNFEDVDWKGKTDAELWSPELAAEFRVADLLALDENRVVSNVERVPIPGGAVRSLSSHKFPLQVPGGERLIGGFTFDISDQVEAEARALQALAEKEVLLREVHHRVKNNLQVICSLLGLQAGTLSDPDAATALRNSQDRVQSMALIHELLYGSEALGDIDFSLYARRLLDALLISYGLEASGVRLRVEVSPLRLGIDRAVPCGLILNELISNSLKYAFVDGRQGEICVSLALSESNQIRLAVEDNGVGLPAGFSVQNSPSLGLRIVQILAKQLGGRLEIRSAGGLRFEVAFPSG